LSRHENAVVAGVVIFVSVAVLDDDDKIIVVV